MSVVLSKPFAIPIPHFLPASLRINQKLPEHKNPVFPLPLVSLFTLFSCPASSEGKKQKEISVFFASPPSFLTLLPWVASLLVLTPSHPHIDFMPWGPGQHVTPRVASYSLPSDSSSCVAVFLSRLQIFYIFTEGGDMH